VNDGCFGWLAYILIEALFWIGCSGCALPVAITSLLALLTVL
jgi:hypothetical protein